MNEVTKIHLGRQAFTIAVPAHYELKKYLEAIAKGVKDKDVVEEIELRMAELLTEHGVTTQKVILPEDVEYLKAQLGSPQDFQEDDAKSDIETKPADDKKLFRDTNNAMVAGVASGLASYFGLDVLLVRIVFVLITIFTSGLGLLLYIILWLLVPEAKSSSDRLRMAGLPVTVDNLKDIVKDADIKGAAHRANATLADVLNTSFKVILKILGILFVLTGLALLFSIITTAIYFFMRGDAWAQYNIFPIGLKEHLLVYIAAGVSALISLFTIIVGIAMFRRKWPVHAWVTGVLAGIMFISIAAGSALAADAYKTVADRYKANVHTETRQMTEFTSVNGTGGEEGITFDYEYADTYKVGLEYYDNPDTSKVKTTVKDRVLYIDTGQFDWLRDCPVACFPETYDLVVKVYSPDAEKFRGLDRTLPQRPDIVLPDPAQM